MLPEYAKCAHLVKSAYFPTFQQQWVWKLQQPCSKCAYFIELGLLKILTYREAKSEQNWWNCNLVKLNFQATSDFQKLPTFGWFLAICSWHPYFKLPVQPYFWSDLYKFKSHKCPRARGFWECVWKLAATICPRGTVYERRMRHFLGDKKKLSKKPETATNFAPWIIKIIPK